MLSVCLRIKNRDYYDLPHVQEIYCPRKPSGTESCVPFMPNVLRVFLENGQTKSFKYDQTTTVQEVVNSLEEKLGLKEMEHFSLMLEHPQGPRSNKLSFLHPLERLTRIAARPGSQHFRCLFRLAFVPPDPMELHRQDPLAFNYYYNQCVNDVVGGRFAYEMRYEACLRLAALHIQQVALDTNLQSPNSKVSLKAIEKEYGLARFLPVILLENVKRKEIRKHLRYYLKRDFQRQTPNSTPTHNANNNNNNLIATGGVLGIKLKYVHMLSHLPSFGGRTFYVTFKDTNTDMLMQIHPRTGVLVRNTGRCIEPTLTLHYDMIGSLEVGTQSEVVRQLTLKLAGDPNQELDFLVDKDDIDDLVLMIQGYYSMIFHGAPTLPCQHDYPDFTEPPVPPYHGLHSVRPSGWNYNVVNNNNNNKNNNDSSGDNETVTDNETCTIVDISNNKTGAVSINMMTTTAAVTNTTITTTPPAPPPSSNLPPPQTTSREYLVDLSRGPPTYTTLSSSRTIPPSISSTSSLTTAAAAGATRQYPGQMSQMKSSASALTSSTSVQLRPKISFKLDESCPSAIVPVEIHSSEMDEHRRINKSQIASTGREQVDVEQEEEEDHIYTQLQKKASKGQELTRVESEVFVRKTFLRAKDSLLIANHPPGTPSKSSSKRSSDVGAEDLYEVHSSSESESLSTPGQSPLHRILKPRPSQLVESPRRRKSEDMPRKSINENLNVSNCNPSFGLQSPDTLPCSILSDSDLQNIIASCGLQGQQLEDLLLLFPDNFCMDAEIIDLTLLSSPLQSIEEHLEEHHQSVGVDLNCIDPPTPFRDDVPSFSDTKTTTDDNTLPSTSSYASKSSHLSHSSQQYPTKDESGDEIGRNEGGGCGVVEQKTSGVVRPRQHHQYPTLGNQREFEEFLAQSIIPPPPLQQEASDPRPQQKSSGQSQSSYTAAGNDTSHTNLNSISSLLLSPKKVRFTGSGSGSGQRQRTRSGSGGLERLLARQRLRERISEERQRPPILPSHSFPVTQPTSPMEQIRRILKVDRSLSLGRSSDRKSAKSGGEIAGDSHSVGGSPSIGGFHQHKRLLSADASADVYLGNDPSDQMRLPSPMYDTDPVQHVELENFSGLEASDRSPVVRRVSLYKFDGLGSSEDSYTSPQPSSSTSTHLPRSPHRSKSVNAKRNPVSIHQSHHTKCPVLKGGYQKVTTEKSFDSAVTSGNSLLNVIPEKSSPYAAEGADLDKVSVRRMDLRDFTGLERMETNPSSRQEQPAVLNHIIGDEEDSDRTSTVNQSKNGNVAASSSSSSSSSATKGRNTTTAAVKRNPNNGTDNANNKKVDGGSSSKRESSNPAIIQSTATSFNNAPPSVPFTAPTMTTTNHYPSSPARRIIHHSHYQNTTNIPSSTISSPPRGIIVPNGSISSSVKNMEQSTPFEHPSSSSTNSAAQSKAPTSMMISPEHYHKAQTDLTQMIQKMSESVDELPMRSPRRIGGGGAVGVGNGERRQREARKMDLLLQSQELSAQCKSLLRHSSIPLSSGGSNDEGSGGAVDNIPNKIGIAASTTSFPLLDNLNGCLFRAGAVQSVATEMLRAGDTNLFQGQILGAKVKEVLAALQATLPSVYQAQGKGLAEPEMKKLMRQSTTLAATLTQLIRNVRDAGAAAHSSQHRTP